MIKNTKKNYLEKNIKKVLKNMLTSKYKSVKIINSSLIKMNKKYIEFNLKI